MKTQRALELARHLDAPLVQIMEGGGFRPTEPAYYTSGATSSTIWSASPGGPRSSAWRSGP